MLHEAIGALTIVFDPARFSIICCGVVARPDHRRHPWDRRARGATAFLIAIPLWVAMYLLFNTLLHVPWPPSLLGDTFPQLRALLAGLI